jgi:type IV pilus assembly protein PilC
VVLLVTVILPQLMAPIASQPGMVLPLPTRILLGFAAFMKTWWLLVILAGVAATIGWRRWISQPANRLRFDSLLLRVPVLGTLLRDVAVARFTRTLGTLVSAGVPILEAVLITRDTCGNYVFEKALNRVHDSIREGEAFAVPLRESKVVDSLVVNMIDVGEETGDMDVMLTKIADNYDEEVDVAVGSLLSLLEPFMVIILGGIIGGIVLALFLPLVSMIESVSGGGKK